MGASHLARPSPRGRRFLGREGAGVTILGVSAWAPRAARPVCSRILVASASISSTLWAIRCRRVASDRSERSDRDLSGAADRARARR